MSNFKLEPDTAIADGGAITIGLFPDSGSTTISLPVCISSASISADFPEAGIEISPAEAVVAPMLMIASRLDIFLLIFPPSQSFDYCLASTFAMFSTILVTSPAKSNIA
jgi:hypothetical protein